MYKMSDIYPGVVTTTAPQLEYASGGEISGSIGPTVSWLGILIVLVAWRVIIELAEEV